MNTRLFALAMVAVTLAACAPGTTPPARDGGAPAPEQAGAEDAGVRVQQAAGLINRHRARRGCPELRWDSRAVAAAQAHSDDMARRNYFSHTSPDGQGPVQRLQAHGVTSYTYVAENIARTTGGAREVVTLWLDSPQHRGNIENCRYTHHGLAVSGDRWTHVFFTPRG